MVNNIWVELQEARKVVELLKKAKTYKTEESPDHGYFVLVNGKDKVIYDTGCWEAERVMFYAIECHVKGQEPTALDLKNFDRDDGF